MRSVHGRSSSLRHQVVPPRRVLAVWLAASAVVLSSGCGPQYPNCNNDGHCKSKGEYCVDKKCAQCRERAHCPGADSDPCVTCQAGACGRKPGCCANNLDCGEGKKCLGGTCRAQCASDQDCPAGRTCNEQGACVAASVGCDSDSDCEGSLRCKKGRCVDDQGRCQIVNIHFEFNRSLLSSDAQDTIGANVKCMRDLQFPQRVVLEGHCDERGTDAYNLELGNRRARAVKKYLRQVAPRLKVQTVSYGKTRPLCQAATESCWSENRRVVFKFKK